jgi:hypothetical protein
MWPPHPGAQAQETPFIFASRPLALRGIALRKDDESNGMSIGENDLHLKIVSKILIT